MTTTVSFDELPATSGSGPAEARPPLARFIQERRDAGSTTTTDSASLSHAGRAFERPDRRTTKKRSAKRRRSQRRNRRQASEHSKVFHIKRKSATEPRQRTRARTEHGCDDSTTNTSQSIRSQPTSTLKCQCGGDVKYAPPEKRCEDCFANDAQRFHGRASRATIHF